MSYHMTLVYVHDHMHYVAHEASMSTWQHELVNGSEANDVPTKWLRTSTLECSRVFH